ncbi:MAG: helix-turn-helix domain-containing protein [Xanthobacteraceae bacterium]|nr:helix-turn-helix domain-containing protein [Xanthobacteraceae bacterium]
MHTITTAQERRPVGTAAFIAAKALAPVGMPSERRVAPAATHMLFGLPELTGITMTYDRNGEIYGEGEAADYVYKVVSGAVRTYKVLNDGRRQINAFYLPGDCFGLELGDEHTWSSEAIVGSTIAMVKRSTVLSVSKRDGEVARQLWSMTAGQLDEARNHALLLIKSAQERVAAFLLEMSQRLADSDSVELPMGRQDIADYLGLTIETVSRTLTQLENTRTIELLTSRVIALRNRSVLSRLNG